MYKAIQAKDVAAMEVVMQEHGDYALVAATAAVMAYASADNMERVSELLTWVFETGKDPTEHPFFRKYLKGSLTLEIATGITAELPTDRQALGLMLTEVRQEHGDISGAIEVVERLEPTSLAAVSLAELYTVAGRYEDVVDLTDGLTNEDDATAILLVFRGHSLRMLEHFTAARETLRDALRSSKRDPAILQRALVERAYAYLGEGKKGQAKKDAERLMAQDRSHPLLAELLELIDPPGSTPHQLLDSDATDDLEPPRLPPPSAG